jgi:hypothetical protein
MKKCPDCQGELETGCLIDHGYGAVMIQRYAKIKFPQDNKKKSLIETDFNDIRRVIASRCTKCNRIFQYAQDFVVQPNIKSKYSIISLYIFLGLLVLTVLLLILSN